jgi:hypothetical protein
VRLDATARLGLLGVAIIGLVVAGALLHVPGAENVGSVPLVNAFVALLAVAGVCHLGAVAVVLRQPVSRRTIWLVLAVAGAIRVPPLIAPPFLSSDLYRYVWDGRVQQSGINPYRYIPADPALTALRDAAIYPHINRRDYAPTIYPPMAQVIFRTVAALAQSTLAIKLAMVTFELLGVLCLIRLLTIAGLPTARVLIYAWNPLAAWDFAGNGHIDAAAAGLVALALLLRAARRDGWTGIVLGAAVAVKFLPAAVVPALWRRWDWKLPLACIAVIIGLYACYASVGWRVFGFLADYGREEGLDQGGGFWLLAGVSDLMPLTPLAVKLYLAATALVLGGLAVWVGFRGRQPLGGPQAAVKVCGHAALLATAALIAASPHYPWYFPWLAVPACLAPLRSTIWLSVAALLLYVDPLHEQFLWPALLWAPAIVLALLDLRRAGVARLLANPAVLERNAS